MPQQKNIKELILSRLQEVIDKKIKIAESAIDSAKESRDSDTKSSAGDKHETGRAMMQIEMEENQVQLSKALFLKQELSNINMKKEYKKVEFGSLVYTNQGNYFISIGIGKLEIEKEIYYSISLASPIGKLLQDKCIDDKIQFQEKEFIISNII